MTENDANAAAMNDLQAGFRAAMRHLVATVTIVAAGDEGSRGGMVATAVMSVSADPPSLVVGINRDAGVWSLVKSLQRFSVNLLSVQHTGLVPPFSGQMQGEQRFTMGEWETHRSHVPYLRDAVVSLFCRVDAQMDYGTHTLFVGAVEDVRLNENAREPLLWRGGRFANATVIEP